MKKWTLPADEFDSLKVPVPAPAYMSDRLIAAVSRRMIH